MIQEMKLIPVPEGKHPFAAAAGKCRFDEIGYVEELPMYTEKTPVRIRLWRFRTRRIRPGC